MRVTHLNHFQEVLRWVQASQENLAGAEEKAATGRRIHRSSDDPVGMQRAMELRAALRVKEQAYENAGDGLMWVNLADARLQDVISHLQRARELAVQGASFANTATQEAIAVEFASIRDQLLAIANSTHQDRALFAGFSTGPAVANVAGAWVYQGDNGAVLRRIGDNEQVQVNVTADDVFGLAGLSVFDVLDSLETAALAGDQASISTGIGDVDVALGRVLEHLTAIGTAGSRIEGAQNRHLSEINATRSELSEIEDVDLAEAVLELRLHETSLQATMAAIARSSQPSLVDFLR